MAYRSFSCLQTGIRINSCCLSMGSMLKPEAPRFFSSFRRFTAAVQNGRIGSKIRKMNRPSVIRARGHMVSLYPYRHKLVRWFCYEAIGLFIWLFVKSWGVQDSQPAKCEHGSWRNGLFVKCWGKQDSQPVKCEHGSWRNCESQRQRASEL